MNFILLAVVKHNCSIYMKFCCFLCMAWSLLRSVLTFLHNILFYHCLFVVGIEKLIFFCCCCTISSHRYLLELPISKPLTVFNIVHCLLALMIWWLRDYKIFCNLGGQLFILVVIFFVCYRRHFLFYNSQCLTLPLTPSGL